MCILNEATQTHCYNPVVPETTTTILSVILTNRIQASYVTLH